MLSLDTETTGLDLYHGARPFLVTVCQDDGTQHFWEWNVDPLTREVEIPAGDLDEIRTHLRRAANWAEFKDPEVRERHALVLQNAKFDATALAAAGLTEFPWAAVRDTLRAGHLLASNQPHDLTSMALHYLGVDIQPYEDATEKAVKECRRLVQQARLRAKRGKAKPPLAKKVPRERPVRFDAEGGIVPDDLFGEPAYDEVPVAEPDEPLAAWLIAGPDVEGMPSAKGDAWKNDLWLPRAMIKHLWETSPAGKVWEENRGRAEYPSQIIGMSGWVYHPPEVSKREAHRWWTVTAEYANTDSAATLELWQAQREEIKARGLWEIYLECLKVIPLAQQMERRGVTVSGAALEGLEEEYAEESAAAGRVCVNIAASLGCELTLPKSGNSAALVDFCFGKEENLGPGIRSHNRVGGLGLPALKRSDKTGNPSLDKAVLEQYEATLPPNGKALAFVRALRNKRKRDTALQYMAGYRRYWLLWVPVDVNPATEAGWYVLHPNLNPTGTDTLRWSSSNPNEQNISKQEGFNLRRCFGPAPGREWWSLDAKNIELRIPAYLSGEPEMIELFERPDDPPYYGSNHLLNFHTVYPDLWEKELREVGFEKAGPHCKKKYAATWYQCCKNGGFCKQYGGQRAKTDATFRRAGAYDLLASRFAKLEGLNRATVAFAEKYGYVETVPDRSVCPERGYPLLCTRTPQGGILPTVPLNYKVQGTAMWWTMKAMLRCEAQLAAWRAEGFDSWLTMQVHDELVFDFPKGGDPAEEYGRIQKANGHVTPRTSNLWRARVLQELMALGGEDIGVPTPTGCEYHAECWGEGVTL